MYIQTESVHVYNVFTNSSIDGTVTDERKSNTSEMGVTNADVYDIKHRCQRDEDLPLWMAQLHCTFSLVYMYMYMYV